MGATFDRTRRAALRVSLQTDARRLVRRLAYWLRFRSQQDELREELAFHREMLAMDLALDDARSGPQRCALRVARSPPIVGVHGRGDADARDLHRRERRDLHGHASRAARAAAVSGRKPDRASGYASRLRPQPTKRSSTWLASSLATHGRARRQHGSAAAVSASSAFERS
jgi:hypothetical protein